jgi:hypothetical protein
MSNVISLEIRRQLQRRAEKETYKDSLDSAYEDIAKAFVDILITHSKSDVGLLAMVKFAADVVQAATSRPCCGDRWREMVVEVFLKQVRKPPG